MIEGIGYAEAACNMTVHVEAAHDPAALAATSARRGCR